MNISGIGSTSGSWPVSKNQIPAQQTGVNSNSRISIPSDELDISPMARMMAELQSIEENDPSRADLIARIRDEIQQGNYDTDEKLESALVKFLQQIQTDNG